MKFIIPLLSLVLLAISCGNSEDQKEEAPKNDVSILFGNKNFEFPELSAPAKEQAIHWGILEDYVAEAKNANGSNYQELRNRSELLREYSDSLVKKIPDTLNTNPIKSRLFVLKTRSELLFQAANQSKIDSLKLENSIEKMNMALKNLIVQLNQKFQKDKIDFQRKDNEENELKKQKRFRDSILNLELQDIKNKKV
ncbi:hypothetical protein [Aequorivita capsosiphonis]|uniref:hypothetical protein n=1 Tax=Aequorivita capsosiphonis TaxID=487317 RepID=UPI0003FC3FE3|nr:hypothetical protein [Aequorivita capsosiphonis]